MKKINILFDLDGTLIDSTDAILESFSVAYSNMNRDKPTDEDIKSQIGYPLDLMFSALGVEDEDIEEFVYQYKMHYRKINQKKTRLLPQAKESIIEAYKIANLAVVTTKTSKYSIELLKHLEIYNYFDVFIGRDDVENPKPHKEPILKALKGLNNSYPSWMIGDTCLDMLSAKGANINSIAVTCGYATISNLKECSDMIRGSTLEAVKEIQLHTESNK
ncbi:Phosphoglycolate phosphatase [hydrothermal vent metagenome]|uniref:Phosphoglycolate phosphatase n=1 Tax=hydrothermal vent metagenome TaxID=652676 RepID=A0A1W1EHG2_9ZZZZ